MFKTIFDIEEKLPLNVFIKSFDKPDVKPIYGYIEKIIPDTKEFLLKETDATELELESMYNNLKSLSIAVKDKQRYLLNDFRETLIVTTSNLFVTTYIHGIKLETQSTN